MKETIFQGLTNEEIKDAVMAIGHILMFGIRHVLVDGDMDRQSADCVRSLTNDLKKRHAPSRAKRIAQTASDLAQWWYIGLSVDSFKKDKNPFAAACISFFHKCHDVPAPDEIQNAMMDTLCKMSTTSLMSKTKTIETILDETGGDTNNKTASFTGVYYNLRKHLETPEEKKHRRAGLDGIGDQKSGDHLADLVAEELEISTGTLRKRLKKCKM